MSKEKRQIEKEDLIPADTYAKNRKQIRKDLVKSEAYFILIYMRLQELSDPTVLL